ncbi:hypothetical protein B0H10DRAFT_2096269 [Mycena sp. CBHHK59/15]|nr:hypothetical protein B0H10DRAFT_2096269 [Mycena sp. CBHHK59/15]
MIPTPQSYPMPGTSMPGYPNLQPNFSPAPGFANAQNFLPQTTSQEQSLHQGADPNSPELFKQNLKIIRENLVRLQELARNALMGIQNAYHPGRNPTQTDADLAALKQTLQMITDMMRQSGAGGLLLISVPDGGPAPPIPTEDQLISHTTRSVQILYDQLKRGQDSAAVVANLLNSTDHSSRPSAPR